LPALPDLIWFVGRLLRACLALLTYFLSKTGKDEKNGAQHPGGLSMAFTRCLGGPKSHQKSLKSPSGQLHDTGWPIYQNGQRQTPWRPGEFSTI